MVSATLRQTRLGCQEVRIEGPSHTSLILLRTRPLQSKPSPNPAQISPDLQHSVVFRSLLRTNLDQIRMTCGARQTCEVDLLASSE